MIPIVVIPGHLCTAEIFAPQLSTLWRYGPVTFASHLEGTSVSDMAANILEHAPQHFALIGTSMGGYIALEIMRQAPERVVKLALLDTSAHPESEATVVFRERLMDKAVRRELDLAAEPDLALFMHQQKRSDAVLLATLRRMKQDTGIDGFLCQAKALIARPDARSHLQAIRVPTLVLVGEDDRVTPVEFSRELAQAIPDARLEIIAQCGHIATLEQPQQVNAALEAWLKQ